MADQRDSFPSEQAVLHAAAGGPSDVSETRRRALERIVFAPGDAGDIERAARELDDLRRAQPAADTNAEVDAIAEPDGSENPDEPPKSIGMPRRRARVVVAGALVVALGAGVLLGSFAPQSQADGGSGALDERLVTGDPLLSSGAAVSRKGNAFIDSSTGQIVGYASTAAAPAFAVFDRAQTPADQPTFPLAADVQPSTTRLLDMAGAASIFAARDTLARPCLVVVGPNQYAATCTTSFDFPKAGIRLSWAPSVSVNMSGPAESGRTSPVVYTAIWLADGSIEIGALTQGG